MIERNVRRIILHCSDSDYQQHDDISVIDEWHKQRGWNGVGYHYFIKSDGNLQIGRDESEIGAHCYGFNDDSIGICLHGETHFSEPQFRMLNNLIRDICERHDIIQVQGHRFFDDKKNCPNFDVSEFKKNYALWDFLKNS